MGYCQLNGKQAVAAQKALFFYSFATQIDWPSEFKSGNFVLGIYGDHELFSQLVSRLSSSKRGNQPFKIVEFKSSSEIKECHILYVDASKSQILAAKNKELRKSSTLI
ncbi:MAG: YfiR family protein, partial [Flavobacteriales bacterium]|nr:YfiR family protein [Flavobacteriales bacterium]